MHRNTAYYTTCTDCGIFTTTTGTSPNRIFYIEYRTIYFSQTNTTQPLNYEVHLYENGARLSNLFTNRSLPASTWQRQPLVVGVKQNDTTFTQVRV